MSNKWRQVNAMGGMKSLPRKTLSELNIRPWKLLGEVLRVAKKHVETLPVARQEDNGCKYWEIIVEGSTNPLVFRKKKTKSRGQFGIYVRWNKNTTHLLQIWLRTFFTFVDGNFMI